MEAIRENTPEMQEQLDSYFSREKAEADKSLKKALGLPGNFQLPQYDPKANQYPKIMYHKDYAATVAPFSDADPRQHLLLEQKRERLTRTVNDPKDEKALGSDWSDSAEPRPEVKK